MCNILDARGFIHFIYFTERKGALNEEPSRPRGRGRQITIASARGWRRQTRNKNVNFRLHPLTDTLALAVSFAEHFQFRPSQRSNRNGLSRIYFYGALVPFLWLFLLWQSICQKPFFFPSAFFTSRVDGVAALNASLSVPSIHITPHDNLENHSWIWFVNADAVVDEKNLVHSRFGT